MAEEEKKAPEWKHDQEISFKGVREGLTFIKSKLEVLLEEKKKEFARMSGVRDSIQKPK
jgi:hypothetical protein